MIIVLFISSFYLPLGKAEDTPSPVLTRVCISLLRLHPWSPWIWGILDFCTINVLFKIFKIPNITYRRPVFVKSVLGIHNLFKPGIIFGLFSGPFFA